MVAKVGEVGGVATVPVIERRLLKQPSAVRPVSELGCIAMSFEGKESKCSSTWKIVLRKNKAGPTGSRAEDLQVGERLQGRIWNYFFGGGQSCQPLKSANRAKRGIPVDSIDESPCLHPDLNM